MGTLEGALDDPNTVLAAAGQMLKLVRFDVGALASDTDPKVIPWHEAGTRAREGHGVAHHPRPAA